MDFVHPLQVVIPGVSRVPSNWRRQGLVDSGRQWVAIRDEAGLGVIADR